jgi:hypothetical protein
MIVRANRFPLMFREHLMSLAFVALLCVASCHAQVVTSLHSYSTLHTVASIDHDKDIQRRLELLLGNDYQRFVSNFDVWGEPRKLAGGGLLIEGWLRDLYLYKAAAFAIFSDGRIYAARVDVADKSGGAEGAIRYYSNDPAFRTFIFPALDQWATRFRGATTVTRNHSGGQLIGPVLLLCSGHLPAGR